jgi:AcrR family transcriptional regulator
MARHRAKNQSNESTKDLLIQAARKLFALHGYKATTVKDIADKAGVNISLISYHFDGKENLYKECVDKHGSQLYEMAMKVLKPSANLEEFRLRIKMFLEECLLDFVKDPELCLMAYREAETFHPSQPSQLNQDYLKFYNRIIEFVESGKTGGYVSKDINSHLAAGILFGGISHFVKMDKIREKEFGKSIKEVGLRMATVEHLSSVFLNGVLQSPE